MGPGDGEVLVAPLWCGICGTDVHEYTDGPIVTPVDPHPLTGARNPQVLGHEFSAEVLEVGGGVTNVGRGPGVGDAADLLRALLLLPARPAPPVRHDGVHRAEPPLGRPRRGRDRVGRSADPHPRRARRPAGRPRRTDRRVRGGVDRAGVGPAVPCSSPAPGRSACSAPSTPSPAGRRRSSCPNPNPGGDRSPRRSASRRRSIRQLWTSSKPCTS